MEAPLKLEDTNMAAYGSEAHRKAAYEAALTEEAFKNAGQTPGKVPHSNLHWQSYPNGVTRLGNLARGAVQVEEVAARKVSPFCRIR